MAVEVTFTDDPASVLKDADAFLAVDPVRNNIMFTLLNSRVMSQEPGRYWIAKRDGDVCGVVFNSPYAFPPLAICADREVVEAFVEFIAGSGVRLTGVSGEASIAAAFAGQWTEATNSAAVPTRGTRLYEATEVRRHVARGLVPRSPSLPAGCPPGASRREGEPEDGEPTQLSPTLLVPPSEGGTGNGTLRLAKAGDRRILVDGLAALSANAPVREDPEAGLDRRMKSQDFWVWEVDGKAVSMAATNNAARRGVTPINAVYTPPELRGRGYATACVAALTSRILDQGQRAILYTNLANPTSNSIYRRIGYRAVEESIMYRFEG